MALIDKLNEKRYTKVSGQPGWQRYLEPAIRYSWGDILPRVSDCEAARCKWR